MRKIFKIFIFIVVVFGLSGCLAPTPQDFEQKEFSVLNLNSNKELNFDEFMDEISKFDIILLGESHKDNASRFLESKISTDLAKNYSVTAVLEMFDDSKNEILQTAKSSKENIKSSDLRKAINWDKRWKWRDYEYMVQKLFYSDIVLTSGNLTDDEKRTIMAGAQDLKGEFSIKQEVKEKIKKEISKAHEIDKETLEKFVQAQQYKDRRMADKLVHAKTQKAILIAGAYHTNKEVGVPLHIKDFKTPKSVAVVYLYDEAMTSLKNSDYIIKEKR